MEQNDSAVPESRFRGTREQILHVIPRLHASTSSQCLFFWVQFCDIAKSGEEILAKFFGCLLHAKNESKFLKHPIIFSAYLIEPYKKYLNFFINLNFFFELRLLKISKSTQFF
jgi:hypothetical protein